MATTLPPQTADPIRVEPSHFACKVPPLLQRVVEQLNDGARTITLDVAHCPYIDAVGLGVLVQVAKRVHDATPRGRLVLAGVHEDLATLFELTKIGMLFDDVQRAATPARTP